MSKVILPREVAQGLHRWQKAASKSNIIENLYMIRYEAIPNFLDELQHVLYYFSQSEINRVTLVDAINEGFESENPKTPGEMLNEQFQTVNQNIEKHRPKEGYVYHYYVGMKQGMVDVMQIYNIKEPGVKGDE